MKGSGIKDLCYGVVWKILFRYCCFFGSRCSGVYCLFNVGFFFLEFYIVKIVFCF